ncbi:MAG: tetratricopeptide repeat protein [Chitinophagaceae bacterium]
MKNLKNFLFSLLVIAFVLPSCNSNSTSEKTSKTKSESKITDIPATTRSADALASFKEGLALSDMGDRLKARAAFSKAIEQDPKFGMAYLMRAGSSNSAKEFADDIAKGKSNLDSASSWEKMYAEYIGTNLTGDRNKGMEIMQKIAGEYPDAARAQIDLGNAYGGNKQYDKARECYNKAIQLDPKWVGGYSALSNSYLFVDPKDLKKAEENALKLVELAPKSAGAQIALGDCYRAQNDLQKAREAYAKAVALDTNAPEAYYKLGHANTYLGNMDEARKNYADAGMHDFNKSGAVLNTANTWLYAGDAKTAEKYIMDQMAAAGNLDASQKSGYLTTVATIAIHNGDAATLKNVVAMLQPLSKQITMDLGNTAETKIFETADSLHWQAMIAVIDGKFDQAKSNLEAMKTVVDPLKDPRKLEGYEYDMGMISMKQKNYADAVSHFEKADPVPIYNKYMPAKANEAAGNKDKATTLYREVAAYNFNDVGNALIRSEVKKKLGTP